MPVSVRREQPGGEEFLEKFKKKYSADHAMPDFVKGTYEEVSRRAKDERKPLLVYFHDHMVASCEGFDREVLTNPAVIDCMVHKFTSHIN